MQGGKGYLTGAVLVLAFLVASLGAQSFSMGIDRNAGFNEEGCVCHGPGASDDGVANPNVRVLFELTPNPMRYEPGETYALTVGAAASDVEINPDGNKGGFNLLTNVGTLAAAEGWEDMVKGSEHEFTHTFLGDANGRTFNLTWTAPDSDEGAAVFTLYVNTVNGNGLNDEGDHWNSGVFLVPGPGGEIALGGGGHDPSPVDVGVRWFAHWVGLISLAAVVATLVLYYFVLKYGESIHTTDHRDRQEK